MVPSMIARFYDSDGMVGRSKRRPGCKESRPTFQGRKSVCFGGSGSAAALLFKRGETL